MVKYEVDDVTALEHCILNCLYSYICFQKHQDQILKTFSIDGVPHEINGDAIRCQFYIENFHNYLSEMYSFFERKEDQEILDQLKLVAPKRKIHREIRHGLSHFGKEKNPTYDDVLKMKMSLIKDAGLDIEVADFLTMTKYCKKMLSEPESYELFKAQINGRLNSILGLFDAKYANSFIDELMG